MRRSGRSRPQVDRRSAGDTVGSTGCWGVAVPVSGRSVFGKCGSGLSSSSANGSGGLGLLALPDSSLGARCCRWSTWRRMTRPSSSRIISCSEVLILSITPGNHGPPISWFFTETESPTLKLRVRVFIVVCLLLLLILPHSPRHIRMEQV